MSFITRIRRQGVGPRCVVTLPKPLLSGVDSYTLKATSAAMTTFHVPTPEGTIQLAVVPGTPFFIVGRNGSGKSALVHYLASHSGSSPVTYLPGSRTTLFDAEGLSLTPAGRTQLSQNLKGWDSSPDIRWRNVMGNNARNEKALHDLIAAESQYKNDLANKISDGVEVEKSTKQLQSKSAPLDRANSLVEQAGLTIRLRMQNGDLRVVSGANEYSYARMSDGERAALIMIAEVIVALDGTILIVDEPELHLHRAIVVPLVRALVKTRPECAFVVSTHELELPPAVPGSTVCLVRSATWTGGGVQSWTIDILNGPENLPEDLRKDILGSRRRVLFTEGDDASLDVPMYALLFPSISVSPRGGCREVERAVAGTRATASLHHTEGFGLVDNDGMSSEQIAKKQAAHVYALPVFSIESLYYDPEVIKSVAQRQAETLASTPEAQDALALKLVSDANTGALVAAAKPNIAEQLAAHLAERQVRDELMSKYPTKKKLIADAGADVTLTTPSPYSAELARFTQLRASGDAAKIIARYPVRSSGILGAIAEALRFPGRDEYEAAARTRVSADPALKKKLQDQLEPLTAALNA